MLISIALAVDQPWNLSVPSPAVLGAVTGLALLSTALADISNSASSQPRGAPISCLSRS
jgi:hypothetical protein